MLTRRHLSLRLCVSVVKKAMAITNHERVGKALELLKAGLGPFVARELKARYGEEWQNELKDTLSDTRLKSAAGDPLTDVAVQLVAVDRHWGSVFRNILGKAERSLVNELIDVRNRWAHQNAFSGDDTDRALDSAARLLSSVSASEADEVNKMKMELRRLIYDEQVRGEKRKAGGSLIEAAATGNLKPWTEIATPHKDVASGNYQQAEFAADLWQVHIGEGSAEYRDPTEFFRRTFLTESLKRLLIGAVQRLNGKGGDPVVQLQTNFGGGKTHSMLALYHLFSGTSPSELPGAEELLQEAGVKNVAKATRVVLVGNRIPPGSVSVKSDGTEIRTLWGEIAYQLGGPAAFAKLAEDDRNSTSPGDKLRELFVEYGPCLILIDEWVAYARMLHDQSDLPAGGFETQFTFAQALTESAKLAGNCLLVISLPASDTSGSPHTQAEDVEVGGVRGREALDRLRNVVGRVESSWRPASAEEGFEIVRRRLFEPMSAEQFKQRDVTARAFADLYRQQHQEFPPECREADYESRIKMAYPIHPEIFDRLYTDWSTLVKFQRTRGVLRLMASVIHTLWEKGDKNPLIMPSMIPIDDSRVRWELTRYLSDEWSPIIDKDVDGPSSLPMKIDGEITNLGKIQACRRVARTVYLGSAPTSGVAHRGLEDRRIKLGCVMPGESPNLFGDALRRLAGAATYLYQDGNRYWYSTQPTVTKLAEDRRAQFAREPDKIAQEIEKRLRSNLNDRGDFRRIHPVPATSNDVPDDLDARLVVLGIDHPFTKEPGKSAEAAARSILETRGSSPRIYRNTLVFLAADKTRLQDLDEAVRNYLAWESILNEKKELNLDPHQVTQAENQLRSADSTVNARVPETYQWLIVPAQAGASDPIEWKAVRLSGSDSLAVRATKKLKSEELLLTSFGGTLLRMDLDKIPLWRGDSVEIRQLVEDFARYLYLPRLLDPTVLLGAIRSGVGSLTWQIETFAFAESYDEQNGRYRGLKGASNISLTDPDAPGLLVKPDVAAKQLESDQGLIGLAPSDPGPVNDGTEGGQSSAGTSDGTAPPIAPAHTMPNRFFGSVELDPQRIASNASQIADEVIAHLVGLVGADVKVTLEIEARIPSGVNDQVVRTVTENSRTLRFTNHGFESE